MTRTDLFPRPRHVEWHDGFAPAGAEVVEIADPSLPADGYRLEVSPERVELRHGDANGARHGRRTLAQLGDDGGRAACCVIEDHPDIAVRGHMLDISRDRVPTRETLTSLVERLAACRYNHLQLYTEHTFAYADHETVWRDASPMTADDLRWLDRLCTDHGIELAANQNTFGHMERWLAHDHYRQRAETPDGFEMAGVRRSPTALAPTPDNADLAVGLVREMAANVASRRVNIGCDEVWELGQGASAASVAERGKTAVFVEHLTRIAQPLLDDGYEVQFWADMIQRAPEAARHLADQGAIAAVWGYEAPLGIDPSTFDFDSLPESIREVARDFIEVAGLGFGPRLEAFAGTGFRVWAVPGTSGWNSFVGRHANARANIADAVDAALEHRAEGVLVTEWGDNGHIQSPFAALPALAYGGATMWCRATNKDMTDDELARSVSRHLLGDDSGELAGAMIDLGLVGTTLGLPEPNGSAHFYSWIDSNFDVDVGAPEPDALKVAMDQVERALHRVDRADPRRSSDGGRLVAETRFGAALVRHGLARIALRNAMAGPTREELTADLARLREEHRLHWLARSRPGGLDDSLGHMTEL